MSTLRLTGDDTIKINGKLLTDFGKGEVAKLTFGADVATVTTGKNGNAIYAKNSSGYQASLELHLLRGSEDDKFLNTQVELWRADSATYVLMNGEITKRIGDGSGKVIGDTHILTGGVISKLPEKVVNVEGDAEQAMTVYTIAFAVAPRALA